MKNSPYLTAKEFSALTHVPLDTIKYYDRINLLKPAFVGENKYRYYLPEQALQLTLIVFNVRAHISLKDIRKLIQVNDTDASMQQYMNIYSTLGLKINEMQAMRNTINNLKYYYNLARNNKPRTVFSIYLPEWFMIYSPKIDITSHKVSRESNLANDLFFKGFYSNPWPHYQLGAFYDKNDITGNNYANVSFFLKTDHPEEHEKEELAFNPSGTYLCYTAYTKGIGMQKTVKDYLKLLKEENKSIVGNIYVVDVINSLITSDPHNYCTMIYAKSREDDFFEPNA